MFLDMPAQIPSFFTRDGEDIILNISGSPGASRTAFGKPRGDRLKISVATPAENGRATQAMVRFLADAFGVPLSHVTVISGETSIYKRLRIHAPRQIPLALQAYIGTMASDSH